jgi:hypothetical protein
MANTNLSQLRVVDPVATDIIHGFCQASPIAPFVAPVVNVDTRAGHVIRFTKEQFALVGTKRSPGSKIPRLGTSYEADRFYLEQHAAAAEVTFEAAEEAENGDAQIDLRAQAIVRAAEAITQSWENEVITEITDVSKYEVDNRFALAGTDQFSDPASDPEVIVQNVREAVRDQVGCYPNRAVMDVNTYNTLRFHPIFRDRIKFTSSGSVNLDMLAAWFDLPGGIMISKRKKLDADGCLSDLFPSGTMVLFVSPDDELGRGFMPLEGADRARPSAWYTYSLRNYPVVYEERYDEDCHTFVSEVVAEQSIVPTSLGCNGLIGAGAILTNTIA